MQLAFKIYQESFTDNEVSICNLLAASINNILTNAESKLWHAHPVWFLNGNPIVGYSKQKNGIRLMFWSGADFNEERLNIVGKKFKDASIFYTDVSQINLTELNTWLKKSIKTQWDYKNLIKRKGILIKLDQPC